MLVSSPVFYYRSMQRTSYPNVVHYPTSSIASSLYVSMAPLADYAIFFTFHPLRIALIMTLHSFCICYAFPCPIYPTYLTWLSTPKCIGKLWWWYPFVLYLTPRMFLHQNSSSNRFCVTIWHYCLVLLLLALVWPALWSSYSRMFLSLFPIPPRYGRMPLWFFPIHGCIHTRRSSLAISILRPKVLRYIHLIFLLASL